MEENRVELQSWLEICLDNENLNDINIQNYSFADKSDGLIGDIIFIDIKAKKNENEKEYHLVLKCSKFSEVLIKNSPSDVFFYNENYFYQTLLPAMKQFEITKGIESPFNSVPKYYGSILGKSRDVIALENLKFSGFDMWDRKKPMTRNHIDLIIKEYAKFHAISAAMKDQNPKEFDTLTLPLKKLTAKFSEQGHAVLDKFAFAVEEIADLLQGDLDDNILAKWRDFGKYTKDVLIKLRKDFNGFEVINHGDCWNNNFMFQIKNNDIYQPTKVSIIDWQIIRVGSPISDLSHFLFCCISEDDLQDLDSILDNYYHQFSNHLQLLNTNPNSYPKKVFLADWKKYSKLGLFMTPMNMKISIRDKEDVIDIKEAAENGDFSKAFQFNVRNKTILKNRIRCVVKYAVENNLVQI